MMKIFATLLIVTAIGFFGCDRNSEPQSNVLLRNPSATIKIVFKHPVPVSYTIPVVEQRDAEEGGKVFHGGTESSGATNDQNLVTVHWELVGTSVWGEGDTYYFDIIDRQHPDTIAEHLVLHKGQLKEIVDTDRVSITIGPKNIVEDP
jgi:hypothetical protein